VFTPGANPTIASYNASAVKIYSAVNSMARFLIKKYFSPMQKRFSLLQRWLLGVSEGVRVHP
jgi:hypothetical protein